MMVFIMLEKLKKLHAKYKLRYKMISANLLISILPIILIVVIFSNVFLNTIEEYVSDSVDLYFNQVGQRLEEYLNTVNIVADSVFLDKNLQSLITGNELSYWDKYNQIDELFQSYLKFYESLEDIYLMDRKQNIYHSRSVVVQNEFKDFINQLDIEEIKDGRLYITGPLKIKGRGSYFIAYRVIRSVFFDNFLEELGIGAIIINGNMILNIIEENNLPENSHVFIQGENDEIITTTSSMLTDNYLETLGVEGSKIHYVDIDNENYMLKSSKPFHSGWIIRALINRDKLVEERRVIQYTIMFVVLLVFIAVVVITLLFNYRMTYPLKKMADAFDRVATGDFNYKLKFEYKNEITNIEDNFNNMIKEIENLTNRLLESQQEAHQIEMEKKQFQLDGLQSQINAHFLYNTINTIRVMALTDARDEVNVMTRNLVDYFRYISKVDEFVTLGQELEQLNKYKKIEQLRFGNSFRTKYRIEPGMEKLQIVKLSVQPVIENAIFHGLRPSSKKGIIQISAFRQREKGIVRVMDNGKGIEVKELEEIRKGLCSGEDINKENNKESIGIGLINIHKRIQLYFGKEYGLSIKSWQNLGTVVNISYPLSTEGDSDV